jgi:hypothetical protein
VCEKKGWTFVWKRPLGARCGLDLFEKPKGCKKPFCFFFFWDHKKKCGRLHQTGGIFEGTKKLEQKKRKLIRKKQTHSKGLMTVF